MFVRRTFTLLAIAGLLVGSALPAGASGSLKLSKAEAALCELLRAAAGPDSAVHVDEATAKSLRKAAAKTGKKKLIKSARPLPGLVDDGKQVGLQVQALIDVCNAGGAELGALVPAPPSGFAVDSNGDLYSLDLGTGIATLIGSTGIAEADVEAVALACDDTLYAIERNSRSLYTLDPDTGVATKVGTAGLGVEPADAGLTVGLDGELFVADVNNGTFFEIDPESGVAEAIGPLGGGLQISGLATRDDGTIFGFDRGVDYGVDNKLVTIDPSTGAGTVVGNPGFELNLVGIDFDALGVLRGVFNGDPEEGEAATTFTLDPTTGVATDGPDTTPLSFKSLAIGTQGCKARKRGSS